MKLKLPKFKNESGFTLIELLVVVVVISALSGIVVSMINSGGFRDKARDAERVANLKQIQTALELHFSDFRAYPNSGSGAWLRVTGDDNMYESRHGPRYRSAGLYRFGRASRTCSGQYSGYPVWRASQN